MSNERTSTFSDDPKGTLFRGECAIDAQALSTSTQQGSFVPYDDSAVPKSPSTKKSSRESQEADGSGHGGGSAVRTWLSMTAMVAVSLLVILLSRAYLQDLLQWLERLPVLWSVLLFVALFTFVSFPFAFGYVVLNVMAGYLYGFVTGQFVVSVSVAVGLFVSVGLCRRYVSAYARVHLASSPFMALLRVLEGPGGLKVIAMARLTPVPFGMQNALISMTNTKLWQCLLASVVGLTPTQLLNTYMGSTVRSMQEVLTDRADGYVILCAQVMFSIALVVYIGRKAKAELNKLTPTESPTSSLQGNKATMEV